MKCQLFLCLITFIFNYGISSQLIQLSTMILVYPCRDNNKIAMIVDKDELLKPNFRFLLTIEKIPTGSNQIRITFDDENRSGSIVPEHIFYSKKSSFSSDFYGKNGKFPKLRSVFIGNNNFCMVPDEPVSLISGSPTYPKEVHTPLPITITEKAPPSYDNDIIKQILAQNLSQAIVQKPENTLNTNNQNQHIESDFSVSAKCTVEKNSCGRRPLEYTSLIVGGYTAKAGDWPWHVAIFKYENGRTKFICGGTLVSQTTVVTAAHCVTQRGAQIAPEIINVALGKFHLYGGDENPQQTTVKQIYVYERFNSTTFENDIALLKLRKPAIFNEHVQPACLWRDEYEKKLNQPIEGMVAGWGFNQTQSLSMTLQQARLPKADYLKCVQSHRTFFSYTLNANNFCAGYLNGTSPCNGDSGGGYHVFISDNIPECPRKGKWYLHGIVSIAVARTNEAVCDPNYYALFTNVGKFVTWLSKYL